MAISPSVLKCSSQPLPWQHGSRHLPHGNTAADANYIITGGGGIPFPMYEGLRGQGHNYIYYRYREHLTLIAEIEFTNIKSLLHRTIQIETQTLKVFRKRFLYICFCRPCAILLCEVVPFLKSSHTMTILSLAQAQKKNYRNIHSVRE